MRTAVEKKVAVRSVHNDAGIPCGGVCQQLDPDLNIVQCGLVNTNTNISAFRVAQGLERCNRVGAEITKVACTLRGWVYALPFNASTNANQTPFDVYMVIYRNKLDPYITAYPENMKLGQSNDDARPYELDGNLQNFMLPWNREKYTILRHKKIATFRPQPYATGPGLTSSFNPQTATGAYFKQFSCKLPCPRKIKFQSLVGQDASADPMLLPWSLAFYIQNANNSKNLGEFRCKITCESRLIFTDS